MIPSDEQIVELVSQKNEHAKHCSRHPTYDLTRRGRIKLLCTCGWSFSLDTEVDAKNNN